jgi:rhodanese-related sulfurtransferase
VQRVSPQTLQAAKPAVTIFVDTSQDFARGHVPGARWVPRGWLELWISDVAPAHDTPVAVTCLDGRNAALAGATLKALGYQTVTVLDGVMAAWRAAGLPVEQGLSGVMSPPTDMVLSGVDRTFADMMNYLRWEEELGLKYAAPHGSGC